MARFKSSFQTSVLAVMLLVQVDINAQVVNNGGTIRIENGGTLISTGSITNTSGTISNNGRIEVQGNFTNNGTYQSTTNKDSLVMGGRGNAVLTPGGASFNFLTINKATNNDEVKLGSSAMVNKRLDYRSGLLTTDYSNNPSFVLSAPASAEFNIAAGQEIIGSVKRTGWINGSLVQFHSSQMLVATNGGTVPADVTVTMIPQGYGGDPAQSEREVKRKFVLAQNGGNGFTADVRFPYNSSELNTNVEANLIPWYLHTSEWNALSVSVSRDILNRSVSVNGIPAASFAQEWKLADPKYTFNVVAFLKGGWQNTAGIMRTSLNEGGQLPLVQPYNMAPYNYSGTENVNVIPNANIVDWVLLELRKPATGLSEDAVASTVIGRKAGFLLNTGQIVDLDGTSPLSFDINKQGSGNFIVLRHRNHLAVMSNAIASGFDAIFTNDFSILANVYAKPGVSAPPVTLLASSGTSSTKYGLWPGDVERNGSITAADVTPVNEAIAGPASGNTNIYNVKDINLDRKITPADVSIINSSVAAGAISGTGLTAREKKIESGVPGEVK